MTKIRNGRKGILILEDEPDLLELLVELVEGVVDDCRVIACDRLGSALRALETEKIALIISDHRLPDGVGTQLLAAAERMSPPVPFVMCTALDPADIPGLDSKNVLASIQKPQITAPLESVLREFCAKSRDQEIIAHRPEEEFARVRLKSLTRLEPLPCPLFLQLAEKKFVKVFSQGARLEERDAAAYLQKGVQHLYVRKANLPPLLESMARVIFSQARAEGLDMLDPASFAASQSLLQDSVSSVGLTLSAQKLAQACAEQAINLLARNPGRHAYLETLLKSSNGFRSSHSIVLSVVSSSMGSLMPWSSKEILLKLSLASLFHDITLTKCELASIHSLEDFQKRAGEFTAEDRSSFENHPLAAANLLKQYSDIPPDVDTIILQHHERPDGSGFPHRIPGSRFTPLSALFLVAHDFAHTFTKSGGQVRLRDFLSGTGSRYHGHAFQQVLREIELKQHLIAD